MIRSRLARGAVAVALALAPAFAPVHVAPAFAQDRAQTPPPAPARGQGLLGRPSPPQPQQHQGIEFFLGTWTFTWTGRESALTKGPRSGTATFTRLGDSNFAEMHADGKSDDGSAYKESAIAGWNDARKVLAVEETLAGNITMLSVGDWSSPISILFESEPLRVQGQQLRLKRTYSILSPTSFRVTEELSTNGGPFTRLGVGDFQKK
jgi:hypothetical protein